MSRARWVAVAGVVVLVGILARHLVWVDLADGCIIRIRPSLVGDDNRVVKRALAALRHAARDDYRAVCTHVGTINPNPACGGFGGGCFWHHDGQRGRATIDVSTEQGLIWTIGIIVHETCHARQFHEGRPPGFDLEHECYGEDDRILRALVQFE